MLLHLLSSQVLHLHHFSLRISVPVSELFLIETSFQGFFFFFADVCCFLFVNVLHVSCLRNSQASAKLRCLVAPILPLLWPVFGYQLTC